MKFVSVSLFYLASLLSLSYCKTIKRTTYLLKQLTLILSILLTPHTFASSLEDVEWNKVTHCTATYYHPSVQTYTGSNLAGTDGWKTTDFPKTVIKGECHVNARPGSWPFDQVVVYEGKEEWTTGQHFFYVNYLESTDTYSINGQPDPSYSHAQWNITEDALLDVLDSTTGCFVSDEVQICFSAQ
jgi:hypothetical protein